VASDDGLFEVLAEVLVAAQAGPAMQAACRVPAETDGLAHLDAASIAAYGGHFTDSLMTGHKRVLRHVKVIVQHGEIGMTDAAIEDVDFDLIVFERARIVGKGLQSSFGLQRCKGVDLAHA
jgi:hypothetical protein